MDTKILDEIQLDIAADLLKNGEVVAFPTDTVYGVACVYDNPNAIEKMKRAKGRPESKPFPLMVSNKKHIIDIAEVDNRTERIIDAWMPGALTIILRKKDTLPDFATNNEPTVAIRMADDELVSSIIEKVGKPLLVTSANISGEPSTSRYKEVYESLNGRISALIARDSLGARASTIIDLTKDEIKVLREGPITLDRIEMSLKR